MTLGFPLTDLKSTETLGVIDGNGDGRLCGYGMDQLVITGGPMRGEVDHHRDDEAGRCRARRARRAVQGQARAARKGREETSKLQRWPCGDTAATWPRLRVRQSCPYHEPRQQARSACARLHEERDMPSALHERLEALHAELADTTTVDAGSRQALITLLGDITRLLERSPRQAVARNPSPNGSKSLAVGFEAEHPALGTAIRQVVDALGKAGI